MSLLDTLFCVLDRIFEQGNLIANDKRTKMTQLEALCERLKMSPSLINTSSPWQVQPSNLPDTDLRTRLPSDRWDPYPINQGSQIEGSREGWEEEAPEPYDWASEISSSHLLEAVNMLDGGDLLDWVDLPRSSFLFGNVGVEQCPES
jgi:proline utilization trans-activator